MSQITPETKRIGDCTYTMYMLPPMASHDLLIDVLKMIGPTIGPVADAFLSVKSVESIMDLELGEGTCARIFGTFFHDLDKKVVRSLIEAFKSCCEADGIHLDKTFDAHFVGKIKEMDEWIVWGMEVQWGKSFRALADEIKGRGANLMAQALSRPTE